MSLGLEALLAHRSEIDAELRKNKSPVTMMFTDLAGSTSFFDQFGDTAGVKWIEEHNSIVFPEVQKHKGTVVKTIGDSVMAYFPSPLLAVQAAADILRALHVANLKRDPKDKMYVRVALHHGLGYLRGGDVFGDVVNVAARIAKSCLPAQIMVSEAVYLGANESAGMEFRQVGAVQFRGKSTAEQLFEVMWTDEATYAELRTLFPAKKQDATTPNEDFTGGRYVIQSELGRGAMGVVYKAYDRLIGRAVALKTIPLEVEEAERPALVERLKKEANTAGVLDHANIVTVFDVGDEAGVFYFTMQYVEGKTLTSIRENKELWPLDKIYDVADQMLSAMSFAHQLGVIHRDLKPSNMMLTSKNQLKIMDFGIAKFGDSGLTKAGVILGTPSYLAPEQAAGRRIDQRADIFSLGAILYELFTTEKAFPGESTTSIIYKVMNESPIPPRAIEPSMSPALNAVIMKSLAKDPAQRYQSCDELQEALRDCRKNPNRAMAVAASASVQSDFAERTMAAPTPQPRFKPPVLLHPDSLTAGTGKSNVGMVAVIVLVVMLGGGGLFWWKSGQSSAASPANATSVPANAVGANPTNAGGANQVGANPTNAVGGSAGLANPGGANLGNAGSAAAGSAPDKSAEVNSETRSGEGKGKRSKSSSGTTTAAAEGETSHAALRAANAQHQRAESKTDVKTDEVPAASGSSMWSREDIPDLLRKADGYAGQGDYHKAIITYEEVLRVDPKNAPAHDGIARAREAQGIRR